MKLAIFGTVVLASYLFLGWTWLLLVGCIMMIVGLMLSYTPPQDDPVWQKLVRDGVIDEHGNRPSSGTIP